MSVFEDALNDLRVRGSILRCERYRAPWSIEVPDEKGLREALGADGDARVIPFHFVRHGGFNLELEDGAQWRIARRSVAIVPNGESHRMSAGGGETVPMEKVLTQRPPFAVTDHNGAHDSDTDLICGVFVMRSPRWNPLLSAMPAVLSVDIDKGGEGGQAALAARMLEAEAAQRPGSFVTTRLVEIFFAEAMRAWSKGAHASGWFAALQDERIGRALTSFHAAPGKPWTVSALAECAALSPSRFAGRFREVMGVPAMHYVTSWRMSLACRRLVECDAPLSAIAEQVGYRDPAAFSRAFKASLNESPARWRAARRKRPRADAMPDLVGS